ncbi:MAG: radical SAM protein, partial [Alphaproteobacteria bacterium]
MTYRLTLEGEDTLHLLYDPRDSTLIREDGDGEQIVHPAFTAEGPVSWPVPRRVSPDNPGHKAGIRTLKIQMGFKCNYACAYCNQASWNTFLGGAVEDAKLFLRNLDTWFATDGAAKDGGGDLRIEFWGGEPFVYWAKLKILGDELRRRYPRARFNVITNGSLLDDEKIDWLIARRVGVQISHDGPAQKYRNPEDILDDPEKCRLIRRLMTAAGQLGNADGPSNDEPAFGLGFGTVLTRWNYSLAAVRRHIEDKLAVPPGSISSNTEEILLPYDDDALACTPQGEADHRAALHTLFAEAAN